MVKFSFNFSHIELQHNKLRCYSLESLTHLSLTVSLVFFSLDFPFHPIQDRFCGAHRLWTWCAPRSVSRSTSIEAAVLGPIHRATQGGGASLPPSTHSSILHPSRFRLQARPRESLPALRLFADATVGLDLCASATVPDDKPNPIRSGAGEGSKATSTLSIAQQLTHSLHHASISSSCSSSNQ